MDLQSINKPVHIAGYEIPFWNLLLIIGGAVAFISMFMNWIKIEISYWKLKTTVLELRKNIIKKYSQNLHKLKTFIQNLKAQPGLA